MDANMTSKIRYVSLLAFLFACSSTGDGDFVTEGPAQGGTDHALDRAPAGREALAPSQAFSALRDELRPRLNLTYVRRPEIARETLSGISGELNLERFLNVLSTSERAGLGALETRGNLLATRVGAKLIEVDRSRGAILIDDERGYDTAVSADIGEEDLTTRAKEILASLGVANEEPALAIRTLVAEEKPMGGPATEKANLAYKVFVKRIVAGLPVRGEKLVLSYALDGSLRKVAGRWRTLDLDKSRMRLDSSLRDIGELALARVEKAALDNDLGLAAEGELRVLTAFRSESIGNGRFSLKPVGRVFVPITGPGGTMFSEFDFEL
jgi:hypothetical protein